MDFRIDFTLKAGASVTALNPLRKTLDIPAHLADILKMTVKGQTKINLEITGSEEPLAKIDAMVNKIILALICAGLLIGSSLVCTTDMNVIFILTYQ